MLIFIVKFILDNFKKVIFLLSNTCYEFLLLNDTFSIIICQKTDFFQYSLVAINFFCFSIIYTTIVEVVFCERKSKRKITVKNPLTRSCNTIVDPAKIIFQLNHCWIWRYFRQGIISMLLLQ